MHNKTEVLVQISICTIQCLKGQFLYPRNSRQNPSVSKAAKKWSKYPNINSIPKFLYMLLFIFWCWFLLYSSKFTKASKPLYPRTRDMCTKVNIELCTNVNTWCVSIPPLVKCIKMTKHVLSDNQPSLFSSLIHTVKMWSFINQDLMPPLVKRKTLTIHVTLCTSSNFYSHYHLFIKPTTMCQPNVNRVLYLNMPPVTANRFESKLGTRGFHQEICVNPTVSVLRKVSCPKVWVQIGIWSNNEMLCPKSNHTMAKNCQRNLFSSSITLIS